MTPPCNPICQSSSRYFDHRLTDGQTKNDLNRHRRPENVWRNLNSKVRKVNLGGISIFTQATDGSCFVLQMKTAKKTIFSLILRVLSFVQCLGLTRIRFLEISFKKNRWISLENCRTFNQLVAFTRASPFSAPHNYAIKIA